MPRLCILPLLVSLHAFGQGTDASIQGSVTDSTGAVIASARLDLENLRTGIRQKTTSNAAGLFAFASVPPGEYRLTGEADGFQRAVLNKIPVEVGARLNFPVTLEVGSIASSIEVSADSKTELAYATSTVGGMVTGKKVLDLPITSRDALGLVYIQAGLVGNNFAGARIGTLNIQIDGINVQDARINVGVDSAVFASVDRVEEIRVVTSPADAEYGRGSGQIQAISRSGTNEFHGSLFEFHRNRVLNGNTWFNNQRGLDASGQEISPRNFLVRNQFGARIGGPVRIPGVYNGKNRTFFFYLYEGQRQVARTALNTTVFTAQARQGQFRYFPGIQNGNANAAVPTVDLNGNPVRGAGATGDLQTLNLYGFDPNRRAMDPAVRAALQVMPLPNNFRLGDGLNTAGFTWSRASTSDLDQHNVKVDHNFSDKHRLSFTFLDENSPGQNQFVPQFFPDAPGGFVDNPSKTMSLAVTSSLTPRILNEFRAGILRPRLRFVAPWENGTGVLPTAGAQPYVFNLATVTDPINQDNDPQGRISPNYQYRNITKILAGKHAFKFGPEVWFVSTNGFNSFTVLPRFNTGQGGRPVVNTLTAAPLIGRNQGQAEAILNDLAGSMASFQQAFNSPGGTNPQFLAGEGKQRTWKERNYMFFFQDDWKVRQDLTLNLGMRYEYFTVPFDSNGRTAALVNGSASIFGISGTGYDALFRPGAAGGQLTRVELVGPNSPNPDRRLYNPDRNNWGPVLGLSWSLPEMGRWFPKNSTILRAGYQMGYERNSLRLVDVVSGDQPGLREVVTFTGAGAYFSPASIRPIAPAGAVLSTVALNDRTQTIRTYDSNLRTPYVQNFNVTLQRSLPGNMTLDIRYVANKGTRLIRGTDINEHNIFENGLLEAFRITQAGGNAPLFDQMFRGLPGVPGSGSDFVRTNTTLAAQLANNNVGAMASFLNNTDILTGSRGGLLRRAGLPENFFVANPQFASARLTSNFASSTYHSLQVELIRRRKGNWDLQANYTWSKALGEEEGAGQEQLDSYRILRNRSFDKRILDFHRTHVVRSNVTFDFPFGPGQRWLSAKNRVLSRIVGGWQSGVIFNAFSGRPFTVNSPASTYNNFGDNTPDVVGDLPKNTGQTTRVGEGVVYFPGYTLVTDPYASRITTLNGVQGRSTLRAIADPSGRIILRNPEPGALGNLGLRFFQGPGAFRFDLNLIKNISITERVSFQLRADATNFTNSPNFDIPNADITSVNFGRITATTNDPRIVTVGLRLNF